jgi:hypothetical protein
MRAAGYPARPRGSERHAASPRHAAAASENIAGPTEKQIQLSTKPTTWTTHSPHPIDAAARGASRTIAPSCQARTATMIPCTAGSKVPGRSTVTCLPTGLVWDTKREIIRAVVQRIEVGPTKVAVVLRLLTETSAQVLEPIAVTLSRV